MKQPCIPIFNIVRPNNQLTASSSCFFDHFCHFHCPYQCAAFSLFCLFPPKHHCPVPMPTVSGRLFRCTGMEAAEMCHHSECRRGEELCGGMPKGRSEWAAVMYIKKSSLVIRLHCLLTLCNFTAEFPERRTDWKRSKTGSLTSSYQAEPSGTCYPAFTDWLLHIATNFCLFIFFSCIICPKTVEAADQTRKNF